MPTAELLEAHDVALTISLHAILSKHGGRVVCEQCGEDIINVRFIRQGESLLCHACADGAYYYQVQSDFSGCPEIAREITLTQD